MYSCQRKFPGGLYCSGKHTQGIQIPEVGRVYLCPRHYVEAKMLMNPPPPVDDRPRVEPAPPPQKTAPMRTDAVFRARWASTNDRLLRTLGLIPQGWTAKGLSVALSQTSMKTTALLKVGCTLGLVRKEVDERRDVPAIYFLVDTTPK